MTQKGGSEEDVRRKVENARVAFSKLRSRRKMKLNSELKIFKSNVTAVLSYNRCETWLMTKNDQSTLFS